MSVNNNIDFIENTIVQLKDLENNYILGDETK